MKLYKTFKPKFINKLLESFLKEVLCLNDLHKFFSVENVFLQEVSKKSKGISFSMKIVSFHKVFIKNISRKIYKSLLNLLANIFNLNLIRSY